jgi:hypothetical protein
VIQPRTELPAMTWPEPSFGSRKLESGFHRVLSAMTTWKAHPLKSFGPSIIDPVDGLSIWMSIVRYSMPYLGLRNAGHGDVDEMRYGLQSGNQLRSTVKAVTVSPSYDADLLGGVGSASTVSVCARAVLTSEAERSSAVRKGKKRVIIELGRGNRFSVLRAFAILTGNAGHPALIQPVRVRWISSQHCLSIGPRREIAAVVGAPLPMAWRKNKSRPSRFDSAGFAVRSTQRISDPDEPRRAS